MIVYGDNKNAAYKVSFYQDGSTVFLYDDGKVASRRSKRPAYELDNFIFEDTLLLQASCDSASSINFIFTSATNGAIYNMYHKDLVDLLQKIDPANFEEGGEITGVWTFRKKGTSIGLRFYSNVYQGVHHGNVDSC